MSPNFTWEEWEYIFIDKKTHKLYIHEDCPKDLKKSIQKKLKPIKKGQVNQ